MTQNVLIIGYSPLVGDTASRHVERMNPHVHSCFLWLVVKQKLENWIYPDKCKGFCLKQLFSKLDKQLWKWRNEFFSRTAESKWGQCLEDKMLTQITHTGCTSSRRRIRLLPCLQAACALPVPSTCFSCLKTTFYIREWELCWVS